MAAVASLFFRLIDSLQGMQPRPNDREGESEYGRTVSGGALHPVLPVSVQGISAQAFAGSESVLRDSFSLHPRPATSQPPSVDANAVHGVADSELPAAEVSRDQMALDVPKLRRSSLSSTTIDDSDVVSPPNFTTGFVDLPRKYDFSSDRATAESSSLHRLPDRISSVLEARQLSGAKNIEPSPEPPAIRQKIPSSSETSENAPIKNSPDHHQFDRLHFFQQRKIEFSKSSEEAEVIDTMTSDSYTRLDARFLKDIEFVIYAGSGNATLTGNSKANTLAGSIGDDTLLGGAGDDQLIGGAGKDVFVFGPNDGHDQVIDFSGNDRIQLKGAHATSDISLIEDSRGQQIHFGKTVIELVGVHGLELDSDWIFLSR